MTPVLLILAVNLLNALYGSLCLRWYLKELTPDLAEAAAAQGIVVDLSGFLAACFFGNLELTTSAATACAAYALASRWLEDREEARAASCA